MGKKLNECIIPPNRDLEFLFTLDVLSKGQLGTSYFPINKHRKPPEGELSGSIIEVGLPHNFFIADALIQFDKFILPFPKEYYEKLEDELVNMIMDSSAIRELFREGLISFSNIPIFRDRKKEQKYLDILNKSMNNAKIQYDYFGIYSVLNNPYEDIDWLKHHNFVTSEKNFYTPNWISSIDINRLLIEYSKTAISKDIFFPIEESSLKFETESSIYFRANEMGCSLIADRILDFTSSRAYNYILSEFTQLKSEIRNELINKKLFQIELEYETPFGLSLILSELPNNSNPSEIYYSLLEHREDKNFIEFKKWLYNFEVAIQTKNVAKLLKSKKEVESITNSLREEYAVSTIKNSATSSNGYLGTIFEDTFSFISGKPRLKTMKRIINEIEKDLLNRKPKHMQYMYYIGEQKIIMKSLNDEMKRCFSKKIDSEDLNFDIEDLNKNISLYSKANEIANLVKNQ